MSLYRAVYKCPICGAVLTSGQPQEVPRSQLPELLGKVVQNQLFAGNPWLHKAQMDVPHQCPDGSAGLARFAGFQIVR